MKANPLRIAALAAVLSTLSACATTPAPAPKPPPPPPQNLVGTTDELQLVTELALDLSRTYGAENILVVFDIDNTLLAMEQDLGSDQWYHWQKDLEAEEPCSQRLVNDRLAAQGALYFASAMRPTQPNAAEQVRRLQDAGLRVIALSARGSDYRLATFRELRRNGFSFWPGAWPPAAGYAEAFQPEGLPRPVRYEDGVVFAAGQDKGLVLQDLLKRSGEDAPLLIVMADDKQDNLKAMMKAFSWTPTRVQAWRYTREDANVEAFDAETAAGQWEVLQPALLQIEQMFGPDNFDLPEPAVREGCPAL
jgi:hypothetical protein